MKPKDKERADANIIATLDALIEVREQDIIQRKKQRESQNPSFALSCWYAIKDFFTVL